MLMGFHLHDYIAAGIAGSSVLTFIALLVWNGIDDYKHGRITSTWSKPHE